MRPLISFSILLLLPLFIGFSSKNASKATNEHDYCNTRFDFCLEYPKGVLTQQRKSDNDDGISLSSADGLFKAQAYGAYNVVGSTTEDLFQELVKELSAKNKKLDIVSNDVNKTTYEATFRGDKEMLYYRILFVPNNAVVTLMIAVPKGMEEMMHSLQEDVILDTHS